MLAFLLLSLQAHPAETFDGYTFYMGDLHAHTGVSLDVELTVPAEYASAVTKVTLVGPSSTKRLTATDTGTWTGTVANEDIPIWLFAKVLVAGSTWWSGVTCPDGGTTAEEHLWLSPSWFVLREDALASPDTGTAFDRPGATIFSLSGDAESGDADGHRGCSSLPRSAPTGGLGLLTLLAATLRRARSS